MKKLWFFLVVIFALVFVSVLSAQNVSPQFSELKGMEDIQGNTHLLYRIYSSIGAYPYPHSSNNSIYHFDLEANTDTFFLYEGGSSDILFNSWITVDDYSFWNNDPSKYIYCGSEIGIDPIGYIKKYDQGNGFYYGFGGFNIDISRQNDSLIFVNLGQIFISTDGGITWNEALQQSDFNFISLSPFNDNVMYGYNPPGKLLKSIDRGINYSIVDTFRSNDSYSTEFYYDTDETHLYRINRHFPQYYLSASDNQGEPFSWSNKYLSNNPIFFSNDDSQSGAIYLADGKKIFYSSNYGNTFNLHKELENRIVGIYKKPDSDKLYVATKYKIYEITNTTISVIKSLSIIDELAFYPLKVGNKWIYDYTSAAWIMNSTVDIYYREVLAEKMKQNGKKYFEILEKFIYSGITDTVYERIDTTEGKVYRYEPDCPNSEQFIEELVLEVNDSTFASRFESCIEHPPTQLVSQQGYNLWGFYGMNRNYLSSSLLTSDYNLYSEIGLVYIKLSDDNYFRTFILKGMVKNGVVYGDTTLTDVGEENNSIPTVYRLEQNYPNPFNPNTVISYQLPVAGNVTLKVYDILGNQIAALVNEYLPVGNYEIEFNTSTINPRPSSGIYFYRLQAGDFVETKKMILLK